ncbi:MAG: hypothetical protein JNK63_03970 [Chthonomonas sp.]|nr:hypothetical protein [Chthonomonas sp.]
MVVSGLIAACIGLVSSSPPRLITFFPNLGDGVQVRMNFRMTEVANAPWPEATISCTNACNGGVHTTHGECDFSCDTTCGSAMGQHMHIRNLSPKFSLNFNESFGNFEAGVWRLSRNADVNPMRDMLTQHLNRMLSMSYPNGEGTVSCTQVHWNKSPCAEWLKIYPYKTYEIEADCDAVRMVRAGADIQTTQGPKAKIKIGTLVLPTVGEDPLNVITPACLCKVPSTPENQEFGWIPGGGNFGTKTDSYAINWAPASSWSTAGLNFSCPDMNGFNITADGGTVPIRGVIGPGVILVPENAKVQNMGIAEWVRFGGPTAMTPQSPADALGFSGLVGYNKTDASAPIAAKGYAMCLDMDRREPNSADKFKLAICGDETLTRLLILGAKERFKTPRDQTRFWIYRNAANLEEMRKRLLPGPREEDYVQALHEVATVGMADLSDAKYRRCFSPELLKRPGVPRATEWILQTSLPWNAPAIASWIGSAGPLFTQLLGAESKAADRAHAASIVRVLGASEDAAVREATLKMLGELGAEHRTKLVAAKGLSGFGSWLSTPNVAGATHGLAAAKVVGAQHFKAYLSNVSEDLPASLKQEAASLLKSAESGQSQ